MLTSFNLYTIIFPHNCLHTLHTYQDSSSFINPFDGIVRLDDGTQTYYCLEFVTHYEVMSSQMFHQFGKEKNFLWHQLSYMLGNLRC